MIATHAFRIFTLGHCNFEKKNMAPWKFTIKKLGDMARDEEFLLSVCGPMVKTT